MPFGFRGQQQQQRVVPIDFAQSLIALCVLVTNFPPNPCHDVQAWYCIVIDSAVDDAVSFATQSKHHKW